MMPAEILMSWFKGSQQEEHHKVPLSAQREPCKQWGKNCLIKYKWPITPQTREGMEHCLPN